MIELEIKKRTFEALKHPVGSPERVELNCSGVTSEYMPSHKFQLIGDHFSAGYRTKRHAEEAKLRMEAA